MQFTALSSEKTKNKKNIGLGFGLAKSILAELNVPDMSPIRYNDRSLNVNKVYSC